uniref:ethanolamine-phosphate cytidylyltransferase n=1 Tax=Arcella intermedia TaxID=1963864 RepID=A0A6B2L830_9EUKA
MVNGCWDLLHTGHYNALRQAKEISPPNSVLIAGVHSNSEIKRVKGGAFVSSDAEKVAMLRSCKFVDEVLENIPYTRMTPQLLDKLGVDYAAHGDDMPILPDGTKMYGQVEEAGRYLVFQRSEGISTTNLLNRLLHATTNETSYELPKNNLNNFILTSQRMALFSNISQRRIENAKKIVYIDGDFDFFHLGHVEILRQARSMGDFLVVGLHGDHDAQSYKEHAKSLPVIMTVGERALNVLSCKYVDDVILNSPVSPSRDFLGALGVAKVVVVGNHPDFLGDASRFNSVKEYDLVENLKVDPQTFSTQVLLSRFSQGREEFLRRNQVKKDPVIIPKFNPLGPLVTQQLAGNI